MAVPTKCSGILGTGNPYIFLKFTILSLLRILTISAVFPHGHVRRNPYFGIGEGPWQSLQNASELWVRETRIFS